MYSRFYFPLGLAQQNWHIDLIVGENDALYNSSWSRQKTRVRAGIYKLNLSRVEQVTRAGHRTNPRGLVKQNWHIDLIVEENDALKVQTFKMLLMLLRWYCSFQKLFLVSLGSFSFATFSLRLYGSETSWKSRQKERKKILNPFATMYSSESLIMFVNQYSDRKK